MVSGRKIGTFLLTVIFTVLLTSCVEVNRTGKDAYSDILIVKLPPLVLTIPKGWQVSPDMVRQEEKERGAGEKDSHAGSREKNIELTRPGQSGRVLVSSHAIELIPPEEQGELLKAYGRIGIKKYLRQGMAQTEYSDDITIDSQPAVQYVFRGENDFVAVSFVKYKDVLFTIEVRELTKDLARINEAVLKSITFEDGGTRQPQAFRNTQYVISLYISGLQLENLFRTHGEYAGKISDRRDMPPGVREASGKSVLMEHTNILEQICFEAAFLKSEDLLYSERDPNNLRLMFAEVHRVYKKNIDFLPLARCQALALYVENRFADALRLFYAIIKSNPEDPYAKLYLAMIRPYVVDKPLREIDDIVKNNPENILALYIKSKNLLAQGKERAGKDLLEPQVKKRPANIWLNYVAARNATGPEANKKAEKKYAGIVKKVPSFMGARFNLALIYYQLKEYAKGLDQLNAILALHPDDAESYVLKGLIFKSREMDHEAKQQFEFALMADPNNYKALYNLGALCADRLGDPHCAGLAFTRYIAVAPLNSRYSAIVNWLKNHQ